MRAAHRLCEAVHVLILAIWLGALLMGAAVAARTFPMMRDLDPRLPAFDGYDGEHWPIAAGHVADFIFVAVDLTQFIAVILAIITLALSICVFRLPVQRWSTFLRSVCLGVALLLVCVQLFFLAPRMNADLRAYWDHARHGESAQAAQRREAFNARHPTARNILAGTTLVVTAAIALAVWSIGGAGFTPPGRQSGSKPPQAGGGQ